MFDDVLSCQQALDWKRVRDEALAKLIVTPERRDFILATYPPDETGRPGILCPQTRGERVRELDAQAVDGDTASPVAESWRTTFEFDGDAALDGAPEALVAAD